MLLRGRSVCITINSLRPGGTCLTGHRRYIAHYRGIQLRDGYPHQFVYTPRYIIVILLVARAVTSSVRRSCVPSSLSSSLFSAIRGQGGVRPRRAARWHPSGKAGPMAARHPVHVAAASHGWAGATVAASDRLCAGRRFRANGRVERTHHPPSRPRCRIILLLFLFLLFLCLSLSSMLLCYCCCRRRVWPTFHGASFVKSGWARSRPPVGWRFSSPCIIFIL